MNIEEIKEMILDWISEARFSQAQSHSVSDFYLKYHQTGISMEEIEAALIQLEEDGEITLSAKHLAVASWRVT